MDDPVRLLDDDGDDLAAERALLREAKRLHQPTARDREAVLAAVLAEVAGSGGSGGSSSGAGWPKLFGVFLLCGLGLWMFARRSPPGATQVEPTPVIATAAPTASSASPEIVAVPLPPASTAASVVAPIVHHASSASASLASRLREESAIIARAKAAMRAKDYAGAQSHLDEARTKFPNGVLVQERLALEIEILHRTGKTAEAAARADAFLKSYPASPHAPRMREIATP